MRQLLIWMAIVFTLSACASSPPRAQRSEFEDIPDPKGLELDTRVIGRASPSPLRH